MIRPYGAHGVPWRPPHLPCCLTPAANVLGLVRPSPRRQADDDVLSSLLSHPRSFNSSRSTAASSRSSGLLLSGGQCCHGASLTFPHIASSSLQSLQGQHHQPQYQHHHLRHRYRAQQIRGKKTVTTVRLSDLPQGLIQRDPLPPLDDPQDEPVYPTVVLQARQNMQRFDNCVLLTRVGGFYELYFEHADEYGPLLNLKVGSKKTSAGPVPMVSALSYFTHHQTNKPKDMPCP